MSVTTLKSLLNVSLDILNIQKKHKYSMLREVEKNGQLFYIIIITKIIILMGKSQKKDGDAITWKDGDLALQQIYHTLLKN